MAKIWIPRQKFDVPEPRNAADRAQLCGFNLEEAIRYWDSSQAADDHERFFIAGATTARPDTVRLWELWREITGMDPDCTPQPTGNCVAAASDDVVQGTMCADIKAGDREEWRDIHSAFHYATGRVLIGKNRLRGGPGSIGGWQAKAHKEYGVLAISDGLPNYTKKNVDAWGDDKPAQGQTFREHMPAAADFLIKSTAQVTTMSEVMDSLANNHFLTIASNCGYTMKAKGGERGFHRPSGNWSHQMSIWGYSEKYDWIAIKNQWGRSAHGHLVDLETGDPWPPGFLRVRLEDFERHHLRGSECIAYSRFKGFPEQRFDHSVLG